MEGHLVKLNKRIIAGVLILAVFFSMAACAGPSSKEKSKSEGKVDNSKMSVAMITDFGDITDQGFNQTTYEACKKVAEENDLPFTYYQPEDNSTKGRINTISKAINDGYNVIVTPGSDFAESLIKESADHPDVKFVALELSKDDFGGKVPDNVYCAIYHEEIAGYLAGYTVVKLGYTKLGFLGGMALPSIIRYGSGFIQGADTAAVEDGVEVEIKYAYGNQFYGEPLITTEMDRWYKNGTEIIFSCGGDIYTSVGESAQKLGGKMIGVDVDQKPAIDSIFGEGVTVTSAMKGLDPTIDTALTAIIEGKWDSIAGTSEVLGLVSETDMDKNYVGIPESTQWNENFTEDDYKVLVADIMSGKITVDDSSDSEEPTAKNITVIYKGFLK